MSHTKPENLGKQSLWLNLSEKESEVLWDILANAADPLVESIRSKMEILNTDNAHDEAFREAAIEKYGSILTDGDFDAQTDALVSRGEDGGAYVMGFLWVRDEEAGLEMEPDEEPENTDDPSP